MPDLPSPTQLPPAEPITLGPDGHLVVPDHPIVLFIEGDGTGPDLWAATRPALDAAVQQAYGGRRQLAWREVLAGEKSVQRNGAGCWLPEETLAAFREYRVGLKGPLTTPVGGGFRSLNVALRQLLDLYVCLRPVRWYQGVPSPVKRPDLVDMVIFRENTEDLYAGIEWDAGTPEVARVIDFLTREMGVTGIRFPGTSAIGIKPVSEEGTRRLVRAALIFALARQRRSLTLVHKGNILKFTEGGFRRWGYKLARTEFGDRTVAWEDCGGEAPAGKLLVKDVIADSFLQQVLTRPAEYDVVAATNLNGDYFSDALAAQVGGLGMAPGGNVNYLTGHAVFEATHGTAPKYAGQDKVNPGSLILSGALLLEHLGWPEAARLLEDGLQQAVLAGTVTYDLARLMRAEGRRDVHEVSCSAFGQAIVAQMKETR